MFKLLALFVYTMFFFCQICNHHHDVCGTTVRCKNDRWSGSTAGTFYPQLVSQSVTRSVRIEAMADQVTQIEKFLCWSTAWRSCVRCCDLVLHNARNAQSGGSTTTKKKRRDAPICVSKQVECVPRSRSPCATFWFAWTTGPSCSWHGCTRYGGENWINCQV